MSDAAIVFCVSVAGPALFGVAYVLGYKRGLDYSLRVQKSLTNYKPSPYTDTNPIQLTTSQPKEQHDYQAPFRASEDSSYQGGKGEGGSKGQGGGSGAD